MLVDVNLQLCLSFGVIHVEGARALTTPSILLNQSQTHSLDLKLNFLSPDIYAIYTATPTFHKSVNIYHLDKGNSTLHPVTKS